MIVVKSFNKINEVVLPTDVNKVRSASSLVGQARAVFLFFVFYILSIHV